MISWLSVVIWMTVVIIYHIGHDASAICKNFTYLT